MAKKPKTPRAKTARKCAKKAAKEAKPRAAKAAKPKHPQPRSKPWTAAEVGEASAAFAKPIPAPQGELEHLNPYTLLVAVVLSAQATDAGVNKATRELFAIADTPREDAGARRG